MLSENRGRGKKVPKEVVNKMVELALEGKSISEIEQETGYSLTCIKKYLKANGISLKEKKEGTKRLKGVIVALKKRGFSYREIAEKLNLTIHQVRYVIRTTKKPS